MSASVSRPSPHELGDRMRSSRLACTLLAARRAMSTKRVGVLVKDGHAAWPPRLNDCDAELINAATSEELQAKTSSIDALVWVPGVAAVAVVASLMISTESEVKRAQAAAARAKARFLTTVPTGPCSVCLPDEYGIATRSAAGLHATRAPSAKRLSRVG